MSLRERKKQIECLICSILMISVLSVSVYSLPIRRCDNDRKLIALTFDDGPDPKYTPEILDILSEYGVKATFFVVGSNCESYPDIVLRELREGHEVGNHTYSHPRLTRITGDKLISEIIGTENVLFEIAEYRPKLFRPPEGVYTPTVEKVLSRLDYTPVTWSVDTLDWKGTGKDAICKAVLLNPFPGMIILCHDYISHNGHSVEALRKFIPELKKRGFEFVTVSELILLSSQSETETVLPSDSISTVPERSVR